MEKKTVAPSTLDPAHDRTGLARFRTQLALDRTTLAWIRTALTMATFGFGIVGFFRTLRERSQTPDAIRMHRNAIVFGTALIVLGVVATAGAGIAHWYVLRRLRRNESVILGQWPLSVALAMLLAVSGLVALWSVLQR
jgi:putative membrane protein